MKRLGLSIFALFLGAIMAAAQTPTTGDIAGRITDLTGAIVGGGTVTLTSLDQGTKQAVTSDSSGTYRFVLLRPGSYSLVENGMNMSAKASLVTVNVDQVTTVDLVATPGGSSVTVEVVGSEPLLQVEDANISTTFSQTQMQDLPLAGADLTSTALTAPGVVMSTGGGLSSNFFAFGLPGTGNLFVLNGADLMDPYYNINNSGASNNSLGVNEIQETGVVSNGYSAQYGRLPGATVSYLTKSGTNHFHGNALYQYNGSFLNARDWFVAHNALPGDIAGDRPRTVANQWGGSIGGPIWRDKLFGFFDDEGLRYVSAASASNVYIPSAAFQTAVLANIAANHPAETPYYTKIFGLYAASSGAGRAQPTTVATGNDPLNGCADFNGKTLNGTLFGTGGASCSSLFSSKNNNLNTEQLFTVRVDQNIGSKDKAFYRYQHDWGVQATATDPINTAFSANSVQPAWNGQFNETHIFTPNIVNNFTFAGSYYKAIFGPPNYSLAVSTFPTTLATSGLTTLGNGISTYPSGRNVAQYQFVDDLSITKGRNNMKMGVNFRRNNFALFSNQAGVNGATTLVLSDFAAGVTSASSTMAYSYPTSGVPEIRFYSMGLYFQDQFVFSPDLKFTFSIRADRNSDPASRHNSFARLNAPFYALANKSAATPYNQSILTNQQQAYASVEAVNIQPRFGFAFTPDSLHGKTVFRGGVGYFMDSPLLAATSRFTTNAPTDTAFTVSGTGGTQLIDPSSTTSIHAITTASNTAFQSGYSSGATLASLNASVIAAGGRGFSAPAYTASIVNKLLNPSYIEWNVEIQQQLGKYDALDIDYVGNYGYNILFADGTENAFTAVAGGFAGLPTVAPDPRFTAVTTLTNRGHSNYNGITSSYRHQVGQGLTVAANYTFSHALGSVSNGGLYGANAGIAGDPLLQISPTSPSSLNYGSLDYDVKHNASMNYVWNIPAHFENLLAREALGGWTISGVMFFKTGTPYGVYNSLARTGAVNTSTPTTSYVLAGFVGGSKSVACNNPHDTCLLRTQFAGAPGTGAIPVGTAQSSTNQAIAQAPYGFGNLALNSFRGPHFFDTDMRLIKAIRFHEKYDFKVGVTANNLLNHPNFATPTNSVTSGSFGTIQATVVSSPSSLYGNGQGSSPSGRVLALNAGFTF